MRCYRSDEEVCAKIQQANGPHEDLPTIENRRKLKCYGHVSRSSGLAKTILQGTVKGGRRPDRQKKRLEDNIREWTGLEFAKSKRAVENREKIGKTGCEIICGAATTLAVNWLMMMMMMMMMMQPQRRGSDHNERLMVNGRLYVHRSTNANWGRDAAL